MPSELPVPIVHLDKDAEIVQTIDKGIYRQVSYKTTGFDDDYNPYSGVVCCNGLVLSGFCTRALLGTTFT